MRAKIDAVRKDLNNCLIERETAIDLALLALLTGEHLVLMGPPGTAKSLLVREVTSRIQGAQYFERLLTKFSTPEEIFGPLSLSALEQDRYQRVTTGTLVEAHIGFLDEVFKANSAILNSLLSLVNERLYHEGGMARKVPLLSLFGASNELPEDASLGALYDRFLLRFCVPYLTEDGNFKALLLSGPSAPQASMTLQDLEAAKVEVTRVALPDLALEGILQVKHALELEGVSVSDRRWKACGKLLRANAWLSGDSEVAEDHLEVLQHVLWSNPEQIRVVSREVAKVANLLSLEAVELEDAALDLYKTKPAPDVANMAQALEPLLRQLQDIHSRLSGRIAQAPERKTQRAKQALVKIEGWHKELSRMALKSISRLRLAPGAK